MRQKDAASGGSILTDALNSARQDGGALLLAFPVVNHHLPKRYVLRQLLRASHGSGLILTF